MKNVCEWCGEWCGYATEHELSESELTFCSKECKEKFYRYELEGVVEWL